MSGFELYESLDLPNPDNLDAPPFIVAGRFVPASIPALMEKIVSDIRTESGRHEPYTFPEYKRLCVEGSLLIPPDKSDPALYRGDAVLLATPQESPIYSIRKAFLYRQACARYNQNRANEKEIWTFSRLKIGSSAPSYRDYLGYLTAHYPETLEPFFSPWRLPVVEDDRRRHTIISGKSGYGKSTILKVLIYSYIRQRGANGVILFDPHGDLAEEVAKLRENLEPGRLVYFDPFLSPEYTPVINPFDLPDRSPDSVDVATQELIAVFRSVFASSGTHFTPQMEQILKPCIAALMLRGNSSLVDLMDFMDEDKNPPLVRYAINTLHNPAQVDFFCTDFQKDAYAPSKQSIRTKIMILLNSHIFYKCLVGKSTINLKYEMDRGAVVVFNLSSGKMGGETSEAMGRFFIGLIQSIAQQRANIAEEQRKPVHMFVDECELFISEKVEKIMKESRKYRLYLTLAQQVLGHKMSTELKETIISNTAVKITGANGLKTLKTISAETGADLDELQTLKKGEFHLKSGERPSIKIRVPFFLHGEKYTMRPDEWEAVKKAQIAQYYRRADSSGTKPRTTRETPIIDL
jgi:hypothetical protein